MSDYKENQFCSDEDLLEIQAENKREELREVWKLAYFSSLSGAAGMFNGQVANKNYIENIEGNARLIADESVRWWYFNQDQLAHIMEDFR